MLRFLALKTVIESNGWCVELFTVEVGARGYCSKSVLCCFKKLGFNNTCIRNTIKKLSSLLWNVLFVSGWPETINIGILLPTVSSMTPQKKPAIHHLICHLLNRPTVPITIEDDVSFTNKYSLIATINHSGTLNRGHYWAFIKDLHSSSLYSCNDKLVFNVEENSVNNTTSYILFYRKV